MPLPWNERINTFQINPDAATRDDIARMATELTEWHILIAECEELFGCEETATSPVMSNLPNLIRDMLFAGGRSPNKSLQATPWKGVAKLQPSGRRA